MTGAVLPRPAPRSKRRLKVYRFFTVSLPFFIWRPRTGPRQAGPPLVAPGPNPRRLLARGHINTGLENRRGSGPEPPCGRHELSPTLHEPTRMDAQKKCSKKSWTCFWSGPGAQKICRPKAPHETPTYSPPRLQPDEGVRPTPRRLADEGIPVGICAAELQPVRSHPTFHEPPGVGRVGNPRPFIQPPGKMANSGVTTSA